MTSGAPGGRGKSTGCRLLGAAAEVNPGSDAAGWRFVLNPAPDFRVVKALQDALQSRRGQQSRQGAADPARARWRKDTML